MSSPVSRLLFRQQVGTKFIRTTGYLEVADANKIITVFPQTVLGIKNPINCWDFFQATGEDYGNYSNITGSPLSQMGPNPGFFRSFLINFRCFI